MKTHLLTILFILSLLFASPSFAIASTTDQSFKQWLFEYIPEKYPEAIMTDHTHWLQAHIGENLVASWAEWTDENSTLKAMEAHSLTQGKALFIEQKGNRKDWADHPNVTFYEGGGYYISGYDPATMGEWNGRGLSVIQFEGVSKEFAKTIALAWDETNSFKRWLFRYLPARFPSARMIDHTHWLQGNVTDDLVVNWTEWTDENSTLKAMESHGLKQGEAMFIEQKGEKLDWANHPAVTYFEGAGYYISGYDSATMSSWDGKGLSVIQFDGDAKVLAQTIAMAWARKNSFEDWLYQFLPVKYPNARMSDHGHWKQAHITDDIVASWEQWNEKGITLKYLEDHSLTQGKAFFIDKREKTDWAEHSAVTYFEGVGIYCSGYDSVTMNSWGVEGLTVIQFDGDSNDLAETIAQGWQAN